MKLFLTAFLAIACVSANPTLRDVTCPDVGLLCLDSTTYTYCVNLGIMKIVGSTVYSCPVGFVCDHSTTTPCVAMQHKTGDSIDVAIKQAAIDQDDLERRLAETTTEEPDFQTFQTTFDPPGITVKQSLDNAIDARLKNNARGLNVNLVNKEIEFVEATTGVPDLPTTV